MTEIRNGAWELVSALNMNPVSNGDVWGELYRFPIWADVPAGVTVTDGWSMTHTAPAAAGNYTLYQYVQDGTLMGFEWEAN